MIAEQFSSWLGKQCSAVARAALRDDWKGCLFVRASSFCGTASSTAGQTKAALPHCFALLIALICVIIFVYAMV